MGMFPASMQQFSKSCLRACDMTYILGCLLYTSLEPSLAVAVMIAVPFPLAVTLPLADTVTTAVLLEVHISSLLVALEGAMVAKRSYVVPEIIVLSVVFS